MKSKYKKITIALAGLFVLSSTYGQTAPGTGRITFNGELTANTCSINGGDVDQTVQLPKVSTSSLSTAGAIAGSRMFQIRVEKCAADVTNIAAHFETFNIDAATGNARNVADAAGAAKNVTVQLVDGDGTTAVKLGDAGKYVAVSGTGDERGARLDYGGQYYATGATTAGIVQAVVKYTIAYQ
ncbi:fimbrial protein [Burkholderia glumae]|uniref:Type 1 fimbrial protein n=1 Tax=Burkholderia glumae TaxID=337 RepID=A0AAQ0BSQ7_BURGL|nr:fimbrial protein [Burkholderia glumae]ACR30624.1 Fimbrial protein [Burkholderia glumae BGR1]AJY64109.1 fimbrial family protein [Burkholderia glumae LMG 2196 = ATCC 33617]KHJ64973.1 fimbrial protein [Burkholderia glumae]MCM2484086.1 type 1 fimbrial protein [Burkholderia glumae]MCM2509776.1 type 1 fimbrial protein [Burkholderia glumae]